MNIDKPKLKGAIAKVRKALVGVATAALLQWLHKLGVEIPIDAVSVIVDAGIVGAVVYAVPNANEYLEVHVEVEEDHGNEV